MLVRETTHRIIIITINEMRCVVMSSLLSPLSTLPPPHRAADEHQHRSAKGHQGTRGLMRFVCSLHAVRGIDIVTYNETQISINRCHIVIVEAVPLISAATHYTVIGTWSTMITLN